MAVASSDIKLYLSGGGSNADPDASLGGAISSVLAGTDVCDPVSSAEASAGSTEYRAVFLKNTSATDTWYSAKVWIASNTPSSSTAVQIALADEGVASTIETVANETTAPTGPVFADAPDLANALTIGNLGPGEAYGIWIKRAVTAGAAAYDNDGFTLQWRGNTTA